MLKLQLRREVAALLGALLAALSFSCASPQPGDTSITLDDVDAAVAHLVDSLANSPALERIRASETRPTVGIDYTLNDSEDYENTGRIVDTMQTELLKLDAFDLFDERQATDIKSRLLDKSSDAYGGTVPALGELAASQYFLVGVLYGETERLGRKMRKEYRLVMRLYHLETGQVKWQDSYDIRKSR